MMKHTLALLAMFALNGATGSPSDGTKHNHHGNGKTNHHSSPPNHKGGGHGPQKGGRGPPRHGSKEMHTAIAAAVEALKASGGAVTKEAKRDIFETYCAAHKDEAGCSKPAHKDGRGPPRHGSKEMHTAIAAAVEALKASGGAVTKEAKRDIFETYCAAHKDEAGCSKPAHKDGRGPPQDGRGPPQQDGGEHLGAVSGEGAFDAHMQQGLGEMDNATGNEEEEAEEEAVDEERGPHHDPHHGPPVGGIILGVVALAVVGVGFRKYKARAAAAGSGTPLPMLATSVDDSAQPPKLVLAASDSPGSSPYNTL